MNFKSLLNENIVRSTANFAVNLARPVAARHFGNFQALVFRRVKFAQVSGKTLGGRNNAEMSTIEHAIKIVLVNKPHPPCAQ